MSASVASVDMPIYKSIEELDWQGMDILSLPPAQASAKFADYLDQTGNTICGRHPLAVVVHIFEQLRTYKTSQPTEGFSDAATAQSGLTTWTAYTQSNRVEDISDHSVSYAAGHMYL